MTTTQKASDLALITKTFVEATGRIEDIYFQLPVAGLEDPLFRERVYCYELYHQMRVRWPKVVYRITGEVDKKGHPWVYHGPLDYSKPDFTIHVPGRMADNLLVIEVKAVYKAKAVNPSDEQIVTDLRKLTGYRKTADYFAACYLIYGCTEADAAGFVNRCCQLAENDNEVDLTLIKLFHHAKALAPATEVAWPN